METIKKNSIGIRWEFCNEKKNLHKKRDKEWVIFRTIRNYWVFSEPTDKELNFGFKSNKYSIGTDKEYFII